MDLEASGTTFGTLVGNVIDLINLVIPLLFAVVFIVIVWKVIDAWILNTDNESKRAEGRQLIIVAVIVFVIMLSVWGIVSLLRSSFFPGFTN